MHSEHGQVLGGHKSPYTGPATRGCLMPWAGSGALLHVHRSFHAMSSLVSTQSTNAGSLEALVGFLHRSFVQASLERSLVVGPYTHVRPCRVLYAGDLRSYSAHFLDFFLGVSPQVPLCRCLRTEKFDPALSTGRGSSYYTVPRTGGASNDSNGFPHKSGQVPVSRHYASIFGKSPHTWTGPYRQATVHMSLCATTCAQRTWTGPCGSQVPLRSSAHAGPLETSKRLCGITSGIQVPLCGKVLGHLPGNHDETWEDPWSGISMRPQ